MMSGVIEGRKVHYVLDALSVQRIQAQRAEDPRKHGNTPTVGDHVPMEIVRVWPNEFGPETDGVNGQCLLDGNDTLWVTSVKFDDKKSLGTWHWIEKV